MTHEWTLDELYPNGRTFFYEGGEPFPFLMAMLAEGLDAKVTVAVTVPANRLEAFYAAGHPVGA